MGQEVAAKLGFEQSLGGRGVNSALFKSMYGASR